MTADEVIAALELKPHPEGGWYGETFRDTTTNSDGRAASTAIYYLLKSGERSAWHRVDATEIWLFHAGDPLRLNLKREGKAAREVMLGVDLLAGQRPQQVVEAGEWQAAEPLDAQGGRAWTLVSCMVAPGFLFEGFELAAGEPT